MASGATIEIADDPDDLARRAGAWLVDRLREGEGTLAVALAGGSTPRLLYERLAAPPLTAQMPWPRIHWFWGDERFVAPDHPDSNYRMASLALLTRAPIPRENIHPIPTEGCTPIEAARRYEAELRRFHAEQRGGGALFDVTLLGIGPDGHTASLFPGSPSLAEKQRWVLAVEGEKPETRITLTLPALDLSGAVAFLATGAEKREAVARVLDGASDLPAALVAPRGERRFILGRDAAPGRTP